MLVITITEFFQNNVLQCLLSVIGVGILFFVKSGYQEIKGMRKDLQEMRIFYIEHGKDIDYLKKEMGEQKEAHERLEKDHNALARKVYQNN